MSERKRTAVTWYPVEDCLPPEGKHVIASDGKTSFEAFWEEDAWKRVKYSYVYPADVKFWSYAPAVTDDPFPDECVTVTATGKYVREIWSSVPEIELYATLAEECTELAHAALKMRRTLTDANPTPVSRREADEKLQEEAADVIACLMSVYIITGGIDDPGIRIAAGMKLRRWAERLGKM